MLNLFHDACAIYAERSACDEHKGILGREQH